jgi:hypothetical protein
MKKKILLLISVVTLGFTAETTAQVNCNLINSVTLNAQQTQSSVTNTGVYYLPNSTGIISDTTQWHYIALTKSGSTGCFYVDGTLVTNSNFTNVPFIWNSLLLGATQGCVTCIPVPNFNGLIDEVRISNVARTANSISSSYSSNIPFTADANTIGLFHLDNTAGTTVSNTIGGTATTFGQPSLMNGRFGQALSFDGIDDYVRWSNSIPVNNMTLEFWVKSSDTSAIIAMLEYAYNTGIYLHNTTVTNPILWSTGDTTSSITVNPSTLPYVWVTDGNCKDTVWFNSQSATIYDTTLVTVTDTLLINTSVTGINPPNNVNTIKIFPNPASAYITIDYGNYTMMNGYQIKITNSLGQQKFQTTINQQSNYVSLASWGGNGLYFVHIIDPQGNILDIRKIVLQ